MTLFKTTDIVILTAGLLILILWLVLYIQGRKDRGLFEGLNDEDYPFHEMYFVGYRATQILKINYKNKQARNLRRQLGALYEAKFADYYLRVVYAQRYTMALTVMAFAAPMYCLSGSTVMFIVILIGGVAAYLYYGKATQDLIAKKKEDILSDFSDVVSKLALLVNSGMIVTEAWEKIAESSEGTIYEEMKRSVVEMRNGTSSADAFQQFGQRCMLLEIRKFTSTLIQGILRGNRELSQMLTQQSAEVWELKKQMVKRKGELADGKLLLPMCLTFAGILIMVVIPIFSNLGV